MPYKKVSNFEAFNPSEAYALVPEELRAFFQNNQRIALAYSGGCDSVFLLACAHACKVEVYPFTINTAFQYEFETQDAYLAAQQIGVPITVINLDIFQHEAVVQNSPKRCYYCKKVILQAVKQKAEALGITTLIDGTNATDNPSRRPGFQALREFKVRSPLREAGLTKEEIRAYSRKMGLITADKPNYSCLATRIPTGTPITKEALLCLTQQDWLYRNAQPNVHLESQVD